MLKTKTPLLVEIEITVRHIPEGHSQLSLSVRAPHLNMPAFQNVCACMLVSVFLRIDLIILAKSTAVVVFL